MDQWTKWTNEWTNEWTASLLDGDDEGWVETGGNGGGNGGGGGGGGGDGGGGGGGGGGGDDDIADIDDMPDIGGGGVRRLLTTKHALVPEASRLNLRQSSNQRVFFTAGGVRGESER